MTDVRLHHTRDGGEVEIVNGRATTDDGPATAVYLSLFGGNEEDAGTAATDRVQWWGNLTEDEPARHLRSETQHLLRALPATAANLRRVEDAASGDLAWMVDELGATVEVAARIPAVNHIEFSVDVELDGRTTKLRIEEPWGSSD